MRSPVLSLLRGKRILPTPHKLFGLLEVKGEVELKTNCNVCPRGRVAQPLGCSDVQVIEELKSCGVENKFKTRINWLRACALCHCTTRQIPPCCGTSSTLGQTLFSRELIRKNHQLQIECYYCYYYCEVVFTFEFRVPEATSQFF